MSLHFTDLADADAVADLIKDLQATHPQVDMLINNAGVALAGNFAHLSAEEFDWLMAINSRPQFGSAAA